MKSRLISSINATETIAQGSKRRILVNTSMDMAVLISGKIGNAVLIKLIDEFERALFTAVKVLLKAPRQEIMYRQKTTFIDPMEPYYFSGGLVRGKVPANNPRYVFDIANSKILRSAANLAGTAPRDADYATCSNANLLSLPLDEKHNIIDRALGQTWGDLQKALKPSAKRYGLILPDLRVLLLELQTPEKFLSHVISLATAKNSTGEVSRRQSQFLFWVFLGYLRRRDVLLLPVHCHYVEFAVLDQSDFFRQLYFSATQIEILKRVEIFSAKYQPQNRRKLLRIVQTVLLSSQLNEAGDVSPEIFIAINGAILSSSSSISYQEKTTTLARNAYDLMAGIWNDHSPTCPIPQPVGAGFRIVEQRRATNETLASAIKRRRTDPFWFADVPNDKSHLGHPISGYQPNKAVQKWAEILRRIFPTFKIKDPVRHRVAGSHWLYFIETLASPPLSMAEIIRPVHINDIAGHSPKTFRAKLTELNLKAGVKNDILSSLSQMFATHIRIYETDARNPIEFDLDRFIEPQIRGKTPRTPLSPEMLELLKEVNSRNNFELSRNLRPSKFTVAGVAQLRHYRRVIDPSDGELKLEWWPGLAVLIDLMLTIPLRGFQARWLDTGEGDEFTLDLDTLNELPNQLHTARKGRQMGVFMSFPKGISTAERLLGLRITTNKRPVECDGRYGVAWCPNNVRENAVMLSTWQRRFNPISKPIRAENETWTSLLRNDEVTALIPEIFPLFRDPGSLSGAQPPTYQQVQTYWNFLCTTAEDELHRNTQTKFRLTRDRVRTVSGKYKFDERVALYDLHTLRVSGITALIDAGLPPNFVQEIVGHSALVMTLYYHKIRPGQINDALLAALESRELSLDFIPEVMSDLNSYDAFLINSRSAEDFSGREMLESSIGNGTYHILSHGICPGGECRTGGEYEFSSKEHRPVTRAGACSLCRYRITGPMFLAGLVVNANKIMAELHSRGQEVAKLNDQIRGLQREGKQTMLFESRREIAHRELEDLWREWAAEHHYVHDSSNLLADYLAVTNGKSEMMPMLAAEGALANIAVTSDHRHPFHLNQLLSEASTFIPSERNSRAVYDRDNFLNELLANNDISPFLLRMEQTTRLQIGNLLGRLMAETIPDSDLQAVHDGKLPFDAFTGLRKAVNSLSNLHKNSTEEKILKTKDTGKFYRRLDLK